MPVHSTPPSVCLVCFLFTKYLSVSFLGSYGTNTPTENSPKDGKGCFICILPLDYHQNATEAHPGLCGSCFLQENPKILLSLVFLCCRKIGPTLCVHAHTGVITWRLAGFPGAFEHPEVKGEGQRILRRGNKSSK